MKMDNEVKKKLLEELMGMMDEMDMGKMPKKGSSMTISMEGDDQEPDQGDQGEGGEGENEGDMQDMQGMDPRLMELMKKKKAEKMAGMRMGH